jgi:HK97 family phage portal protein
MYIMDDSSWAGKAKTKVAKSFLGWLGYDSVLLDGSSYVSTAVNGILEDGKKLVHREGILTWERMWQMYRKNATIRACVDTRIAEVQILNWTVKQRNKELTPRFMADEKSGGIVDFLHTPNYNNESFATLISKVLRDVLVYDAGCIVKVRDAKGRLTELLAHDASKVRFIQDEKGFLIGYRLFDKSEQGYQDYEPSDIIYFQIHPSTNSEYGMPPVESLIIEVSTALNALGYNARYFTENEIPDGVLAIDEITDHDYDKAKSSFRRQNLKEHAIRIIANAKNAKWLSFRGNNKDMQFKELIDKLDERIMYVFAVTKTELGITDTVSKSVAQVQAEIFTNKGVRPLLTLLEYQLTKHLIWDEFKLKDYEFVFTPPQADELEETQAKQKMLTEQWNNGWVSWNECRKELGRPTRKDAWASAYLISMGKSTIESLVEQASAAAQPQGGAAPDPSAAPAPTDSTQPPDGTVQDLLSDQNTPTSNSQQPQAQYNENLTPQANPADDMNAQLQQPSQGSSLAQQPSQS